MKNNIGEQAYNCFKCNEVEKKIELAYKLYDDHKNGNFYLKSPNLSWDLECGRPRLPNLVAPSKLPKRKISTETGHGALIHSIAHIEFNAINLACDAVWRFDGLPDQFYFDWIKVTAEEAHHFQMLNFRLRELDFEYGDFDAHNGLWELAEKTAYNPIARMALVPKLMEARGLDVTPLIIEKFKNIEDKNTVKILEKILLDEIGHVEIGNRWFKYLCKKGKLDSAKVFFELIKKHHSGGFKGPLHKKARLEAGFSNLEIEQLEQLCQKH